MTADVAFLDQVEVVNHRPAAHAYDMRTNGVREPIEGKRSLSKDVARKARGERMERGDRSRSAPHIGVLRVR